MFPDTFNTHIEIIGGLEFKKKIAENRSAVKWKKNVCTLCQHKLTKKEIYIAKFVAKNLKKNNIIFAGIDLISNYLTGDINITSPTGLKNFKDLTGKDLAIDFWNYLETKLK